MRHATADKRFGDLADKYGRAAGEAGVFADRHRYWMRRKIQRAWNNRRSVCAAIQEVPCFKENPPSIDENGLLGPRSWKCSPTTECSLAPALKADLPALGKLRDAIIAQPPKPENQRRLKVLKELIRVPKRLLDEASCRRLGDAIFAFFAPSGSIILTTNAKDHEPLASALGKKVETP
jgi:hypothetical protein